MKKIVVPPHDRHRRANALDLLQESALADISEMPDFVRRRNVSGDRFRKKIVSVGNDGDPKLLTGDLHSVIGFLLVEGGEVAGGDAQDFLHGSERE